MRSEKPSAVRLSAERGGVDPAAGDPYPTVMFATRYGKLDILYRPDGSDRTRRSSGAASSTTIGGQRVYVAARNDLVRMKLAAGRTDDLRDVANLTSSEQGAPREVFVFMALTPDVDREWARDLIATRVAYFDPSCPVSGSLTTGACKSTRTGPVSPTGRSSNGRMPWPTVSGAAGVDRRRRHRGADTGRRRNRRVPTPDMSVLAFSVLS